MESVQKQGSSLWVSGVFNINLFFEGQYVLKKSYAKLKETQSNQRLLKPYLEICFRSNSTNK